MSREDEIMKRYLRKAASKGGNAGTEAQRKARQVNISKARKARWKKPPQ